MKRNFKIPHREQYGYDRVRLGYYPNKDSEDANNNGAILEDE